MPVAAVQHVKRMRGGAQGHLMRCDDGHFYVVKFRNNPQHLRVLANELLASRLAEGVDLPVPATEVIEVGDWLVQHTSELNIQLAGYTIPCEPGLQFGSRYVVSPLEGQVLDYLPVEMLERVRNRETFAGILAIDKWTGNANGRQATFWRRIGERKYTVTFVDQGYCFNAGEWSFPDFPLRGVYPENEVYAGVRGWESFEPWLSLIEGMDDEVIWGSAGEIPPEWYGSDWAALETLVRSLLNRRAMVRELITAFRMSPRRPFPNWLEEA
ncbi:MAG: HipA family kinase [Terriglobales bacterium]